jgi:hypothetical protein
VSGVVVIGQDRNTREKEAVDVAVWGHFMEKIVVLIYVLNKEVPL